MKKILAIFVTIAFVFALIPASFAETIAPATETRSFYSHDLTTGITEKKDISFTENETGGLFAPGYFPRGSEIEALPSPNSIIGATNDMIPVVNASVGPSASVVYIQALRPGGAVESRGTGFMIGPKALVTAAHVVFSTRSEDYGFATRIAVTPAKMGSTNPFGQEAIDVNAGVNVIVPDEYIEGDSSEDWAIIELDDGFPQVGYLGLYSQSASYVDSAVFLYSYPGHLLPAVDDGIPEREHEINPGIMYQSVGTVLIDEGSIIRGTWDALQGSSGAPVIKYINGQYCVIAIHCWGLGEDVNYVENGVNGAREIDSYMYNLFLSYR